MNNSKIGLSNLVDFQVDAILSKANIDIRTVEQGSSEWLDLRLGVVTASEVSKIMPKARNKNLGDFDSWDKTKQSYLLSLVAEVITGKPKDEVKAKILQWGKDNEQGARASFEMINDVYVENAPIIFKDENLRCASSPDGICSNGYGLELKCPFDSSVFVRFVLGGFEGVKAEYEHQVQFSMYCSDLDHWYFSNYDPRVSPNLASGNVHTVIFERDESLMSQYDEYLENFYEEMDRILNDRFGVEFGFQWQKNFSN